MSNYPEWWENKVTLYHKEEDSATHVVSWTKTVYSNCFWHTVTRRTLVDGNVVDLRKAVVRIPGTSFNINDGDIIVKEEISDVINEYQTGSRSTDLVNKYKQQGCIKVQFFKLNTMSGFSSPHCYIEE